MTYFSPDELSLLGFKHLGKDVQVSRKASIYYPHQVAIGDRSRIDDFCVLAGNISIGSNVHLAVFCNLAAGRSEIIMDDFSGLAYGCHVIAQSDDYSGESLTNPTVPHRFKNEINSTVHIGRHAILGTGTVVLPGVHVSEGTSTGALTLLNRTTSPWSIYVGSPGRRIRERSRAVLKVEEDYLRSLRGENEDFGGPTPDRVTG